MVPRCAGPRYTNHVVVFPIDEDGQKRSKVFLPECKEHGRLCNRRLVHQQLTNHWWAQINHPLTIKQPSINQPEICQTDWAKINLRLLSQHFAVRSPEGTQRPGSAQRLPGKSWSLVASFVGGNRRNHKQRIPSSKTSCMSNHDYRWQLNIAQV